MTLRINGAEKDSLIKSHVINVDKWPEMTISSNSNQSIFQTPDWLNTLERCTHSGVAKTFHFEFNDGTQVLWPFLQFPMGFIFKSLVAMPYGLYGKPIISGDWSPVKGREILYKILTGWNLRLIYVENPLDERINFLLPSGINLEIQQSETHILELSSSWEVMWGNVFTKRIRNQVRIAEDAGLTIRQRYTTQDVEDFFRLYKLETEEWGYKQPPYTLNFFINLFEGACNNLKLILAEDQGRVIAGMIYIEDNDSILYWFGTMDKTAGDRFPTYYLISHVIQQAIKQNKKYFNFGASGSLEGVRKFKEMWHAKAVPYQILTFKRKGLNKMMDKIFKIYHSAIDSNPHK